MNELEKWTVAALRSEAQRLKIPGYSGMKKQELINAIRAATPASTPKPKPAATPSSTTSTTAHAVSPTTPQPTGMTKEVLAGLQQLQQKYDEGMQKLEQKIEDIEQRQASAPQQPAQTPPAPQPAQQQETLQVQQPTTKKPWWKRLNESMNKFWTGKP